MRRGGICRRGRKRPDASATGGNTCTCSCKGYLTTWKYRRRHIFIVFFLIRVSLVPLIVFFVPSFLSLLRLGAILGGVFVTDAALVVLSYIRMRSGAFLPFSIPEELRT